MPSFGGVAELPLGSSSSGNPPGLGSVATGIEINVFALGTVAASIEADIVVGIVPIVQPLQVDIFDGGVISVGITVEIPHFRAAWEVGTIQSTRFSSAIPVVYDLVARIYEVDSISVGVQAVLTETTGSIATPITIQLTDVSALQAPLELTVYGVSDGTQQDTAGVTIPAGLTSYKQQTPVPGTPTLQTGFWTTKVLLKGLDVSVNLTGTLMVDREENAAAVAEFTLKPVAGPVDLTSWVRAEVLVYYIPTTSTGVELYQQLLFKGFVDVPTYNPTTRLTTFTCTDELQKSFEAKSTSEISAVVEGFWSENVFTLETDKWSYAQDRLSTIPFTLDYDVNNSLVKTAWEGKATPDFTLNEAVVIDGTLSVSQANSRSIVNTVDLTSTYQYDSFKELSLRYAWEMRPSVKDGILNYGIKTVTFNHVVNAVQSAGWVFEKAPVFTAFPPSGRYAGVVILNIDNEQVVGAQFVATKRYRQYVNDSLVLKLVSPKSVASLGPLKTTQSFSLSAEYSEEADKFDETVESTGEFTAVLNTFFADNVEDGTAINPSYIGEQLVTFPYQEYSNQDYAEVEQVGVDTIHDLSDTLVANKRADFESTLEVLQNLYRTEILGSHRNNSVTVSMLIEPNITREHTVRIDTDAVKAKGKVRQVTHTLSLDTGSALTEVSIAVSRSTGVGIPDTETPLDPTTTELGVPAPSNLAVYGLREGTNTLGNWVEAIDGGVPTNFGMRAHFNDTQFLVNFPAVETSAVDELTVETTKEFIVNVPDEELTLNA